MKMKMAGLVVATITQRRADMEPEAVDFNSINISLTESLVSERINSQMGKSSMMWLAEF